MSPILISSEIEKTGEFIKDKSVNEEKEMDESKVDNVEESQVSITSIRNNNDKANKDIISIKNDNDTVDKSEDSRTTSVSNRPNKLLQFEKIPKPLEVTITEDY